MTYKNFYLDTPMDEPEYVQIKFKDIPQEFADEYNLKEYAHDGTPGRQISQ